MRGVIRMIRKLTVALAATAVVGTAALAPSAANATWRGYGWYGHPYYSYPGYAVQAAAGAIVGIVWYTGMRIWMACCPQDLTSQ